MLAGHRHEDVDLVEPPVVLQAGTAVVPLGRGLQKLVRRGDLVVDGWGVTSKPDAQESAPGDHHLGQAARIWSSSSATSTYRTTVSALSTTVAALVVMHSHCQTASPAPAGLKSAHGIAG